MAAPEIILHFPVSWEDKNAPAVVPALPGCPALHLLALLWFHSSLCYSKRRFIVDAVHPSLSACCARKIL